MNLLKKDNPGFGALLALMVSSVVYAFFYLASLMLPELFESRFLRKEAVVLVSIFINLLPFRFYMLSLKLEKTGRGMLISMFLMMILYFVFMH